MIEWKKWPPTEIVDIEENIEEYIEDKLLWWNDDGVFLGKNVDLGCCVAPDYYAEINAPGDSQPEPEPENQKIQPWLEARVQAVAGFCEIEPGLALELIVRLGMAETHKLYERLISIRKIDHAKIAASERAKEEGE